MRGFVTIAPTICQVCGNARNQYTDHRKCAKVLQARYAEENRQRPRHRDGRVIRRG